MQIMQTCRALAAIAFLPLAACGDFLSVTNPGPVDDKSLYSPEAVPSLVVGMSADLSIILDDMQQLTGIASDELAHGGSYTQEGLWFRGIIKPDDINYHWAAMHRARWVAETGIERMKALTGYNYGTNLLSARANLLAGFANRLLGENACNAVINSGPSEPHTAHFQRAEGYFTEALTIATAANNTTMKQAALAGRASVRAWLGRWNEAEQDAVLVPRGFVYDAIYSTNSDRENNELVYETWVRREFTVYLTPWAQVFNDPRVPWDTIKTKSNTIQTGQDGKTPFFRQRKFTDLGSEVALAKGTEMLMLRAEAALRRGEINNAFVLINEQRAAYGMAALAAPATIEAAWATLQKERGAVVWLEARRLWDLRRWLAETGPAYNGFLAERPEGRCIPISQEELDANPNIG